ncbi:MAG: hypothetical protein ABSB11_06120 [Sedimentisphaerales bacterium]|jgi:hypothetical protein
MNDYKVPEISKQLYDRIRLVRRDIGDLLFHFTRRVSPHIFNMTPQHTISLSGSASDVLWEILFEGKLKGTANWTYGEKCICFTEAPIQEFNSIFSLIRIAASKQERPRYEPYGIAVSKKWLFEQGGRPVIYDHPESLKDFPEALKYRFVPYNPKEGIDFTWEREWRIKSEALKLNPKQTLAVLPTADEAFDLVYNFADMEADWDYSDGEACIAGASHVPKWLAVSLDLFGFNYHEINS